MKTTSSRAIPIVITMIYIYLLCTDKTKADLLNVPVVQNTLTEKK